MPIEPAEINDYWLGPPGADVATFMARQKRWYTASDETDNTIRARFGAVHAAAESGDLDHWQDTHSGAVALVILLDQFTRNLYRGSKDAFRNDGAARLIALGALERGAWENLSIPARVILYHPFHHAEDPLLQRRAVELATSLIEDSPEAWREPLTQSLKFVAEHCEIVKRFGRFPHRNEILGRQTTAEERAFLASDGRTYGQQKR